MPESPLSTMRALIVDDDALDRQAARRALSSTGMVGDIFEAERGDLALELLSQEKFDVVLLDLQLPDASGLEILRDAQSHQITVPFIVLTGYGDDLVAVELMKAGAADYLSKARLSADLLGQSLRHIQRVQLVQAEASRMEAERERLMTFLAAEQGQTEAILTSMTDGLVVSDLAGHVLTMNPAALAMHGYQTLEETRLPLSESSETLQLQSLDGSALPFESWPLSRAIRGEKFSNFEVIVYRRDIDRTWIASYGGAPVCSKNGEVILAIVTIRDITERKQEEKRAALLAEASARLSTSLDAQTTLATVAHFVVPALADWCSINALDANGFVRPLIVVHSDSSQAAIAQELPPAAPLNADSPYGIAYVLRTGEAQLLPEITEDIWQGAVQDDDQRVRLLSLGAKSYLCVPLIVRGQILGTLSMALINRHRPYDEQDLALAVELGRRVAAGLENARLFNEVQARAERETMINKIGGALRVSLDSEEILQIVTEQVGLALNASRCRFLRLTSFRDELETAPPQYTAVGVPSVTGSARLTDWPMEVVDLWVAGRPAVVSGSTDAWIACPVILRGQFGGVFLAEHLAGEGRPVRVWSPDEEMFLSAVTDILALALENARLYAREHRVADMLSSAFLTDIPDTLPGLALAANYRAGLEEAQVGGDYYDAFALPDGRVALVIADVSGKGLSAAVQTATVKYSLRAFATEAGAPGLVLTRLNRMLRSDLAGLGEHFVTLFYAVFEPASGRLAWSSAGHESVLIKRAAGGVNVLEANNPILGLADHSFEQEAASLSVGDSLVLYTDGLTEARDPETRALLDLNGVQRLVAAAPAEAGPGVLAAYLQQEAMRWTGGRPQDDMALLVVKRLVSEPISEEILSVSEPVPTTAEENEVKEECRDDLFHFHFPSRADNAAEVRQVLGHWMATLGFDRAATEDFQTAVTEAVTNAVRHGSPAGALGNFHVLGRRTSTGALHVEVTDSGLGLPESEAFPTMPEPEALGGRGLPLMQELSDSIEFHSAPVGMCVILVKRLSAPATPQ